jgi:hypothetical protein
MAVTARSMELARPEAMPATLRDASAAGIGLIARADLVEGDRLVVTSPDGSGAELEVIWRGEQAVPRREGAQFCDRVAGARYYTAIRELLDQQGDEARSARETMLGLFAKEASAAARKRAQQTGVEESQHMYTRDRRPPPGS